MAKGKKGGKRITRRQMQDIIENFFSSQPGKRFTLKEIFRQLRLETHPMKMLAIDVMDEMAWDDFLQKKGDSSYQLNTQGQVQEGTFIRKQNGKNSFLPVGTYRRQSKSVVHGTETEAYTRGAGDRDNKARKGCFRGNAEG